MPEDAAAFVDYRFEKISRLNKESKANEVWLVKERATKKLAVLRFIKSGKIPCNELKNMSNPILAKIFYCAQDETATIIVEEYIAGETLSEILRGGKFFDEDTVQDFLLQMCDGLKILHAADIVHRDIKPANLIRQSNGRFKLIDLDAARIFKTSEDQDTKPLGTVGYAASEQYGAGKVSGYSDINALGVTAVEMLGKNYHGRLEKILSKCTAYDPRQRYQSVDELKAALTYREVEKKSHGGKILLICATIILSAVIFYAYDSTENKKIPAEIIPQEEKIYTQKKPAEIVEEVKTKEKSTFNEIVLPQDNSPPTTYTNNPAQVTTSQISLPPNFQPSFPNQENITPSTFEPNFPEQMTQKNFIRAKYFFNGKRINDWQDNLNDDVEISHLVHIPAEIWQNNSTPINGTLEILLENFSAESFAPQIEIIFDDAGNLQTKTLTGNILNFGQNYTFRVPMNEFRVESLKDAMIGSAELRIKILGDNVIGSTATINFIFVQKGFPIPQN